jgi:hypothetical protein
MIGKFVQAYFALDDNVIDKKLLKFVNEKTFTSKKNVKVIINEIVQSYAERFCNGDEKNARGYLSKTHALFRPGAAGFIGFFSGVIIIMIAQIIF